MLAYATPRATGGPLWDLIAQTGRPLMNHLDVGEKISKGHCSEVSPLLGASSTDEVSCPLWALIFQSRNLSSFPSLWGSIVATYQARVAVRVRTYKAAMLVKMQESFQFSVNL